MFHLPSTKTTIVRLEGFDRPAYEPDHLAEAVLVRNATTRDLSRIAALARLDDRRMPAGPYLVAELDGVIVAAIATDSEIVVADPFRRTLEATDLLRMRADQLRATQPAPASRRRHRTLRPAAA
jgi:hypothetical protein